MAMFISLRTEDGKTLIASQPHPDPDHVVVKDAKCPKCGATPLKVAGRKGTMRHDHDTYYAEAGSLCCNAYVGTLRTRVSTIFGIEEDERVLLHSGCRVY